MSIADDVYVKIKKAILYSYPNFSPGDFLNENKLAEYYDVSKTPVREALSRLRFENLVEVIPYKGYIVKSLTFEDLTDLFELRLILELSASELAVQRISEEDLERLEKLTVLEDVIDFNKDLSLQFREVNLEFHQLIAECSGNKKLAQMTKQVVEGMQRALFQKVSEPLLRTMISDHQELVEAFRKKDVELVKQSTKQQIELAKARVFKYEA